MNCRFLEIGQPQNVSHPSEKFHRTLSQLKLFGELTHCEKKKMFRVRQFPKFFFRSTSSISQIQTEKLQKFKGEILYVWLIKYESLWKSNNIELCGTLVNLFQGQIPKSDSFYAKIDYLNLPVRHEFSGTKPIRIEEIEEKIISKLTENGHPIKDIHMRHFTDRYTLEVMRIRDKEGCKNCPNRCIV